MGRFPFPRYPNGWFQVAYSDEVKPGDVVPLKVFGQDLVLFRTESGKLNLLDAHCPHMGANLGHGGKVVGEAIACPFHAWKFCGTGECVEIPYAKKVPPRAKLREWTMREVNGTVMVWYHAAGEPPAWQVPEVPEFASSEWAPAERRRWKVKTHQQEMAENAVDCAHFLYVHGTQGMPQTQAEIREHILHVTSSTMMKTPAGKVGGSVESISHGFGFSTTRFTGIVETLLMASVTTIDEDYVDVRFTFTVKKLGSSDVTSNVGQAFIREIERQLGQDIPIWENKIYVNPPLLCDGDGPIGLFRKWVRQFYAGAETSAAA